MANENLNHRRADNTIAGAIEDGLSLVPKAIDARIEEVIAGFKSDLGVVADLERLKRKELLTTVEVERMYSIPAATLETWRSRGGGPDCVKLQKSVYYRPADLERYINEHRVIGCV